MEFRAGNEDVNGATSFSRPIVGALEPVVAAVSALGFRSGASLATGRGCTFGGGGGGGGMALRSSSSFLLRESPSCVVTFSFSDIVVMYGSLLNLVSSLCCRNHVRMAHDAGGCL
jgi:hypothetical protein